MTPYRTAAEISDGPAGDYYVHFPAAQANELAGIRRALERIANLLEDCTWNSRIRMGYQNDD